MMQSLKSPSQSDHPRELLFQLYQRCDRDGVTIDDKVEYRACTDRAAQPLYKEVLESTRFEMDGEHVQSSPC